jgi:hypothetical protein
MYCSSYHHQAVDSKMQNDMHLMQVVIAALELRSWKSIVKLPHPSKLRPELVHASRSLLSRVALLADDPVLIWAGPNAGPYSSGLPCESRQNILWCQYFVLLSFVLSLHGSILVGSNCSLRDMRCRGKTCKASVAVARHTRIRQEHDRSLLHTGNAQLNLSRAT